MKRIGDARRKEVGRICRAHAGDIEIGLIQIDVVLAQKLANQRLTFGMMDKAGFSVPRIPATAPVSAAVNRPGIVRRERLLEHVLGQRDHRLGSFGAGVDKDAAGIEALPPLVITHRCIKIHGRHLSKPPMSGIELGPYGFGQIFRTRRHSANNHHTGMLRLHICEIQALCFPPSMATKNDPTTLNEQLWK